MTMITHTYRKHYNHYSDRVAIHSYDGQVTYKEWYTLVIKTANWLVSLNLRRTIIAIHLPNGIPFLQLFAGGASAGLVVVPFDVKWSEEELRKRTALCCPGMIITSERMKKKFASFYSNVVSWEECLSGIDHASDRNHYEEDGKLPFYMGFTSGSTGEPKAFVRSHESWVESIQCNINDFHMKGNEHVIIPGALIHSHFLYGAISTLYLGGTIYLLEKFTVAKVLSLLKEKPITFIFMVPTMIAALIKENNRIEEEVTIISSGAKWEASSKKSIRYVFPKLMMYEFYGASELSFITALSNDENREKPGSVGKPCFNVDIQVRKRNGELAAPFEVGKIYVKSRMAILGYIYADRTNIQSIQDKDGWSTVHDMGYLDEDGYLYIMGREQNMILYGGMNIFSEEIESILLLHPDVEEVVVIGTPDPYWGELVAAVVKGSASKKALRRFCYSKLAHYKIPRKWYFVDDIPLTSSGKYSRPEIERMIRVAGECL